MTTPTLGYTNSSLVEKTAIQTLTLLSWKHILVTVHFNRKAATCLGEFFQNSDKRQLSYDKPWVSLHFSSFISRISILTCLFCKADAK